MKFIPNAVTVKVGRQILTMKKNSPTVMFGIGVVGVVATAVLASRATLRIEEVLEETNEKRATAKELFESNHKNYSERDYHQDMTLLFLRSSGKIIKLYAPTIAVGAVSIGLLTGSHVTLTRRNAATVAAYAALEKGFNEYRARVLADVGEDKEREYRYGSTVVPVKNEETGETKKVKRVDPNAKSVYARFFDEYSPSWNKTPEYNFVFIRCQQNYANDLLRSRGHVFLNEVYDMLGIERSRAGAVVGWVLSKDGDNFIDFGVFDGDNPRARDFVNGREGSILLDFNVDGIIYDKI